MKRFVITGPSKAINGIVNISGAKNSCLPLMAASILFKKEVILKNVPLVQDVLTMKDLLISLGSKVKILEKETGISPGQACVFYLKDDHGDKVLGGGWIDKTFNNNLST